MGLRLKAKKYPNHFFILFRIVLLSFLKILHCRNNQNSPPHTPPALFKEVSGQNIV